MRKFSIVLKISLFALALLGLASCGKSHESEHIEPVYKHVAADSEENLAAYLDSMPLVRDTYFGYIGFQPSDSLPLSALSTSRMITMFTPQTDTVWKDLLQIENQLGHILAEGQEAGFTFPKRQYAAVVWGKPNSMVLTDSVMLIALNYYLGSNSDVYAGWPEYLKKNRNPENLPYDMAEALAGMAYPFETEAESSTELIQEMLYRGAIARVREKLVEDGKLAAALGWSEDELKWAEFKEAEIWQAIVNGDMLYSTDPMVKRKMLSPAPSSSQFGPEAPSALGVFIGYRIIDSYMKNHDGTKLPDILAPAFYSSRQTLVDADYRP